MESSVEIDSISDEEQKDIYESVKKDCTSLCAVCNYKACPKVISEFNQRYGLIEDDRCYIPLTSLFGFRFVAIDTEADVWGEVMAQCGIKYKKLYTGCKQGLNYILVIFKVPKKFKEQIPNVANKVKSKYLIAGRNDYMNVFGNIRAVAERGLL